ncbi:unannotated protein [freshwater metagenome]|uniref:Unannotated protein n=1 Tax=freshwater metagenome TaxID=449393 RepID=A0A6J7GDQ3_9ZZZZ
MFGEGFRYRTLIDGRRRQHLKTMGKRGGFHLVARDVSDGCVEHASGEVAGNLTDETRTDDGSVWFIDVPTEFSEGGIGHVVFGNQFVIA